MYLLYGMDELEATATPCLYTQLLAMGVSSKMRVSYQLGLGWCRNNMVQVVACN